MQEDLENRTVTLIVNSSKFTGRTLYHGIKAMLRYAKNKVHEHNAAKPQGKQSVKKLIGQDAGVSNADLGEDVNFRLFDQIAKQYGVDYAVKRVEKDGKTTHLVFFKARDADAIFSAMTEYANRWEERQRNRKPSITKTMNDLQQTLAGKDQDRDRHREISR